MKGAFQKNIVFNILLLIGIAGQSQEVHSFYHTYDSLQNKDSVKIAANAPLDKVGRFHRFWFGENYRKDWALPVTLPVFHLSKINGGLKPIKQGGGSQTKSLRLEDTSGKEWVLRSVNKNMEMVLPVMFRQTFAKEVLLDALSAQHPYSALIVPVLADAAGVPHANPVIGVVAPDTVLAEYSSDFVNRICLLEEREPYGESDNTPKMYKSMLKDNDNKVDSLLYFNAKLLDFFIGDWDRHQDQWRWLYDTTKKHKYYQPVPRDRDQVIHVIDGVFPHLATSSALMPRLHGFGGKIKKGNAFFTAGNDLNKNLLNQIDHATWMQLTLAFTNKMTDSVIDAALQRLPKESYLADKDLLLKEFKERRKNMPAAMDKYYSFLNRIVDIQTSDKKEFVNIEDAPNEGMQITIYKINKHDEIDDLLFHRIFLPSVTKEIRLYIHSGKDSLFINTTSKIRLRIIAQEDHKTIYVANAKRNIRFYGLNNGRSTFTGQSGKIRKHLSNDSTNTAYIPTNPYNKIAVIPNLAYNRDDGIMLGAIVKFTNQGFRKVPYGNIQQISFTRSFATGAYRFRFNSEWRQVIGKGDLLITGKLYAPNNTQNFFGKGNNTAYDKSHSISYYRSRFNIFEITPRLKWQLSKSSSFAAEAFYQFYKFDADDNEGKMITLPSQIHSYDSLIIHKTKHYTGLGIQFIIDNRDNDIIPFNGNYFSIAIKGYKGLNSVSRNFVQATTEFQLFKSLGKIARWVIAERIGGGVTAGQPAFYQSLFLGSQDNLKGYRQFRFAGQHMLFNNVNIRYKVADFNNYILPGQIGITGFFDAGKVWAKNYNSHTIHVGTGGGIYFVPAQLAVIQVLAGYSKEGWYPYVTFGFRF